MYKRQLQQLPVVELAQRERLQELAELRLVGLGHRGAVTQGEIAPAHQADLLGVVLEQIDQVGICLLYTSDAADDLLCVDLGGRRIIKKKKPTHEANLNTASKPNHI